jgi:hypothetical protein
LGRSEGQRNEGLCQHRNYGDHVNWDSLMW